MMRQKDKRAGIANEIRTEYPRCRSATNRAIWHCADVALVPARYYLKLNRLPPSSSLVGPPGASSGLERWATISNSLELDPW